MTDPGRSDGDRRRSHLRWAGRAFVSVGILVAAAFFVDVAAVPDALSALPLQFLGLAFVLNLTGSIIAPAFQTHIAMGATRIRLGVGELIAINLMVRFFILVLPRPAAVGLRWWAYRAGSVEGGGADAAALMVYERVVQAVVITGALVLLLAIERTRLPAATDAVWVTGAALFLLALVALAAFSRPRLPATTRRVLDGRYVPARVRRWADGIFVAVEGFPGLSITRKAAIISLSVLYFILFVLSFQALLWGLGVEMGFASVAWIRAAVFLVTLVPVTIGGIGVREAGFVGLLHLYGVPEAEAMAAAVAALGVQLAIGAMGGIIALVRHIRGVSPTAESAITAGPLAPE